MENLHSVWILQRTFWILNVIAVAVVVWRLYSAGLHRIYRFFFAALVFVTLRSILLIPFDPKSRTFYTIWVVTVPILWVSYVLVVLELYSLVLKHYRGIYSVGRMFFFAAVATSAIVSALTVLLTMPGTLGARSLLYYYALLERGIVTSLAIFLLLLLTLVTWFPVPLSRNLLIHCSVYTAYFFAVNVIDLYWHVSGTAGAATTSWATIYRLSVALVCYSCWAFLLSPSGENRIAALHLGRSPLEEKRLLGQLEGLNATLLRTARK
jgi:hypothetical protein